MKKTIVILLFLFHSFCIFSEDINSNHRTLQESVDDCDLKSLKLNLSKVKLNKRLLSELLFRSLGSENLRKNNTEIVKELIDQGADVNMRNKYGSFPLEFAVCPPINIEIIKLLLKAGARVNAQRYDGITALYFAVQKRETDSTELLLKNGADVNIQNSKGETPLSIACLERNLETVKMLLDFGANVNTVDISGRTPLMNAYYNEEIRKILLKNGAAPPDDKFMFFVEIISKSANVEKLKKLLDRGTFNINEKSRYSTHHTPLGEAVFIQNLELIQFLIESGAGVNVLSGDYGGRTPLMLAVRPIIWDKANLEIVKFLLSIDNINVNEKIDEYNITALDCAIEKGDKEIIELLKSHGAKTASELEK